MKKITNTLAALSVLLLTGCGETVGLIPPEDLYPKALTTCAADPQVPPRPAPGQPRSDKVKSGYVKDLHGAYLNCADTVDGWKERRSLYVTQYEHQKYGYFERVWRAVTDKADSD